MYEVKNGKELEKLNDEIVVPFLGQKMRIYPGVGEKGVKAVFRRISDNGWWRPMYVPGIGLWDRGRIGRTFIRVMEYTAKIHVRYGDYDTAGRLFLWLAGKNEDFVLEFMNRYEFLKQDFYKKTSKNSNLLKLEKDYMPNDMYAVLRDVKNDVILGVFRFEVNSEVWAY